MKEVLLVEPDRVLAYTYREALQQAGFKVRWQTNAQGAINSIDKRVPDIVVLEVQLAKHNGVELLHELRSYSDWEHVPVLLLSVIPEHELGLNTVAEKQLGIAGYLYKPHTSLSQLVTTVQEVVGT